MLALEWSSRALNDLDRLDAFLHDKNERAADDAIAAILQAANDLRDFPLIGRVLSEDAPAYRQLPVPFSNSGYMILYRVLDDAVEIQAIKHMREAGY